MRRYLAASAVALVAALVAAPANAGPIVFVSGPSPVAIVSGTLTITGPDVGRGAFLLEAADSPGSWPGGLTQAGFLCATCPAGGPISPAALFSAGIPFINNGRVRVPSQAPTPLPFQLTGTLMGFDLTGQEIQLLFAATLLGSGNATVALFGSGFYWTSFDSGGPAVPEPATVLLLSSGLAGAAIARRRRKNRTAAR